MIFAEVNNADDHTVTLTAQEQYQVLMGCLLHGEEPRQWISDALRHYSVWQADAQSADAKPGTLERDVSTFLGIVSKAPRDLAGEWREIYECARRIPALWVFPEVSLEVLECGYPAGQPYLSKAELIKSWPTLRAAARAKAASKSNGQTAG